MGAAMSLEALIGIAAGAVTILGAVVAATHRITSAEHRLREQKLQTERDAALQKHQDLDARYQKLVNEVAISTRIGTEALAKKQEIDEQLTSLMESMQARAGSVYIPVPTSSPKEEPNALMFLSIQPFGDKTAVLQKKTIPMRSLAGRCFTTRKPFARPEPTSDHYKKADVVSGYRTQDTLNFPVQQDDDVIGVLQLLNKEGGGHFTELDIPRVEMLVGGLSTKVGQFLANPNNLQLLGVPTEATGQVATALFCDLTRSSLLFTELNAASAIQHMNEYLEAVSDVAMARGATVDKYIGDGVLLRFNVPRRLDDHALVAAKTAIDMRSALEELKATWLTMGELVGDLHVRIGVAMGRVHEAVIGHPQHQELTILGPPVSVAVNLCDEARRDRSIIVIDEHIYKELGDQVIARSVPNDSLGKAARFVSAAYELEAVR
jgi:class 3 adenylate cyclase